MRVTVCELNNDPAALERDWQALCRHVETEKSELVLLPEMPFAPWVARVAHRDPDTWRAAVAAHERWLVRLEELTGAVVIGSRPVTAGGRHHNEGFIHVPGVGCRPSHRKYYLPDEAGFWEASWYARGDGRFTAESVGSLSVGFLICTELWFMQRAREYGRGGVNLLVCPRVTPARSVAKWLAGGVAAAVVSGAYCLSSNLCGPNVEGIAFGGAGWIIEPEEGEILGVTSAHQPFVTCEIDLEAAKAAKGTYPRYVAD